MDIAIVTGAETPLGLRIVQSLVQQGCRVHGIGNNFSKVTYADPQFKAHPVDLTDLDAVVSTLGNILEEEQRLDVLIHAIDVTPGTPFDKLPPGNLEAILKIGLLGPVMMTRLALPNLLRFRGQLINVITSNKHGHTASAANALIEGGLREMNQALFNRSRDAGLRITNCVLRQNTGLPGAMITDDALEQTHIDLEDVAHTLEQLTDPKAVNVPAEVVLYPRLSSQAEEALPESILPLDVYSEVVLPPKEYCPPKQPKIPTAEKKETHRTIPYTDDEMEDKIAAAIEDYEAHPERYDQPDPVRPNPQQGGQQQGSQQQEGQGNNKRRRRRRGGRNRNRKPQGGETQKQDNAPEKPQQSKPEQQQPEKAKPKRRVKKKPDAQSNPDAAPAPVAKKKPAKKTPAKKAVKASTGSAQGKAVKKKVAKKAAKKAAKASTDSARGKKVAKEEG